MSYKMRVLFAVSLASFALPAAARNYLERLHTLLECPVELASVGPDRDETIVSEALRAN